MSRDTSLFSLLLNKMVKALQKMRSRSTGDTEGQVIYPSRFRDDDRSLLEGLRSGEPSSQRALYDKYAGLCQKVLFHVLGPDEELEEALHEVFVQVYENVHKVQDSSRLRSWMFTVSTYVARSVLQKRSRRRWLRFAPPEELPTIAAPGVDFAQRRALYCAYRVMNELPVELRIAFALRYIKGLELTQVAQSCGVSLATVKRRLSKAKRRYYKLAHKEPDLAEWLGTHKGDSHG
ncbi:MAG: sigma-70 family RNA polymerase sigma factor [Proteobacteria bacterium]|nr:sigma-70 family RNA polymerase sigma factor [Pseudomonadota bacterium]